MFRGALWKKMVVLFFIVSVLPIGAVSYWNYRTTRADLQQRIYNGLTAIAAAKKQQITQLIKLRQEQVSIIAESYIYRTTLEQINRSSHNSARLGAKINATLKRQVESMESLSEIFITDAKGKIVVSSHDNDLGRDMSDSDVFTKGKDGLYLKDFYFDPELEANPPPLCHCNSYR